MNNQHQVIGEVLNRALHHLRELNIPCLLCLPANQVINVNHDSPFEPCVLLFKTGTKVIISLDQRDADALIEDAAQFSSLLREELDKARVEKIVNEEFWGNKDDGDEKP